MIAAQEREEFHLAEQHRLAICVLEPIRTPGAIQTHGILLAIEPVSLTIAAASENSATLFNVAPESMIGETVVESLGPRFLSDLLKVVRGAPLAPNPFPFARGEQLTEVIVHESKTHIIVEFEPVMDVASFPSPAAVYEAVLRLSTWGTIAELRVEVVRELRELTGFDRVMVYHFHPDGHGEIVAEALSEGMEPYLGLHYPESDIPAQARQLYLSKLSRSIVSTGDAPVALVSRIGLTDPSKLDLSHAELRSVSPHHLQFMRNMDQASTLSLSMVRDGVLIGMVTCAHRTPRRLPFVLRRGLEVFANQVALQLSSIEAIDRLHHRAAVAALRGRLVGQLAASDDMASALLAQPLTVLDLLPADGAALCLDGVVSILGSTPPAANLGTFVSQLDDLSFATDALAWHHPGLALLLPEFAGVLVLPLGREGDYLALFRHEVLRTVNWLGDQRPANRDTPLSPRTSFSSWSHGVTDTAHPWGDLVAEAAELGQDLEGALLQRAQSKLASLAQHDPLTGLPNRRLLMDRLEYAIAKYARGEELALLFVDLDGFKAINDSFGHDAGDDLIIEMSQRIVSATRAQDTVARIGGDEFVVLCENTNAEEADTVAQRIVDAVRQPIVAGGAPANMTASVGITSAHFTFSAVELLQQADAAMYRAKAQGKDQVAR